MAIAAATERADLLRLDLRERFDHVASVCVFEHQPVSDRVEANTRIRDLLREGGSFSITFDYLNPSRLARIDSAADVAEQFVRPSGLRVRGNSRFHDNRKRYLLHPAHHPRAPDSWRRSGVEAGQFTADEAQQTSEQNVYTFGALFTGKA
jgi:hypothetical protein